MSPLSSHRINQSSTPGGSSGVLNLQQVSIGVDAIKLHGTADTRTAVSAITAVAIAGGSSIDEAGEHGMDHGFRARVFARLETGVANVVLADKIELLGEVVAGDVKRLGHGNGESNVFQAG